MPVANETIKENNEVPISRFIIIHEGLLPIHGLDEGASVDELSEYILYYYESHSSSNKSNGDFNNHNRNGTCVYNYDAAIRFAGLCNALYSFPTTTGSSTSSTHDFVKEIELSTCTLIFIPIESNETNRNLVAIAQCPKNQNNNNNNYNHQRPNLLRRHFQKIHEFYQLIKYGGIHPSLQSFQEMNLMSMMTPIEGEDDDNTIEYYNSYPGFNHLYHTHKKIRKLLQYENNSSSNNHNSNDDISDNTSSKGINNSKIHEYQKRLHELNYMLPIGYIRRDLKIYYDQFLDEYNHFLLSNNGHNDEDNDLKTKCNDVFWKEMMMMTMMIPSKKVIRSIQSLSSPSLSSHHNDKNDRMIIQSIEHELKNKLDIGSDKLSSSSASELLNPFPNLLGFSIFATSNNNKNSNNNHNIVCTHMKSNIQKIMKLSPMNVLHLQKYYITNTLTKMDHSSSSSFNHNHHHSRQLHGFFIHDPIQTNTCNHNIQQNDNGNDTNTNDASIWILPLFLNNNTNSNYYNSNNMTTINSAMYRLDGIMDIIFYGTFDPTSQVPFIHTLNGLSQFIHNHIYKLTIHNKKYHNHNRMNMDNKLELSHCNSKIVKSIISTTNDDRNDDIEFMQELCHVLPGIQCLFIDRNTITSTTTSGMDECIFMINDDREKNKSTNKKAKEEDHKLFFIIPLPFLQKKSNDRNNIHDDYNDDIGLSMSDLSMETLLSFWKVMNEMNDDDDDDNTNSYSTMEKQNMNDDCRRRRKEIFHFINNGKNGWYYGCQHESKELYILLDESTSSDRSTKHDGRRGGIVRYNMSSVHDIISEIQQRIYLPEDDTSYD